MSIVRERREHVEILRINRPEAKNAINDAVAHGIEEALDDVETRPLGARRRAHRHRRRLLGRRRPEDGRGGRLERIHHEARWVRRDRDARLPEADHRGGERHRGSRWVRDRARLRPDRRRRQRVVRIVRGETRPVRGRRRAHPLAASRPARAGDGDSRSSGSTIDAAARVFGRARQPCGARGRSGRHRDRARRGDRGELAPRGAEHPRRWCARPAISPRSRPGSAARSCHRRCSRHPTPSRALARSPRSGHRSGRPPDTGITASEVREAKPCETEVRWTNRSGDANGECRSS